MNSSEDLRAASENACPITRRRKLCFFLLVSEWTLCAYEVEAYSVRYQSLLCTFALRWYICRIADALLIDSLLGPVRTTGPITLENLVRFFFFLFWRKYSVYHRFHAASNIPDDGHRLWLRRKMASQRAYSRAAQDISQEDVASDGTPQPVESRCIQMVSRGIFKFLGTFKWL